MNWSLTGVPFRRTGARTTRPLAAGRLPRSPSITDLVVRYDITWVDFDREAA